LERVFSQFKSQAVVFSVLNTLEKIFLVVEKINVFKIAAVFSLNEQLAHPVFRGF